MRRDPQDAGGGGVGGGGGGGRGARGGRLPVVGGGKLGGMLSIADMARRCDMEAAAALADISSNLRRASPPEKK